MKITHFLRFTFAFLLMSSTFALGQSKYHFTEVATAGQAVPVAPQLSAVNAVSMNDCGDVAFAGDNAVFLRSAGTTRVIAGYGDAVPGGGTFIGASSPAIDAAGNVIFRGSAVAAGHSGLFRYSGGQTTLLIADGDQDPSGFVLFPNNPSVNANGAISFISRNNLFVRSNGSIRRLTGAGAPAPGGSSFRTITAATINANETVAFKATLANGRTGVFLAADGILKKMLVTGDVVGEGDQIFSVRGNPSINDMGEVVFAVLANGSATSSGIYHYSPSGQLTVVIPGFAPLPDGSALSFPDSAVINNAGQITFQSQTLNQDGFGSSVFLFGEDGVKRVMTPGQSSPGGDSFTGSVFAGINNSGTVIFISRLMLHGKTAFTASATDLVRVAGQGDTIDRQPRVLVPFANGIGADRALAIGAVFPGGTTLFTTSLQPNKKFELVSNEGQPIGNDGAMQGFFESINMNAAGDVLFNTEFSNGLSSIVLQSQAGLQELVKGSFNGSGDIAPDGSPFWGVATSAFNNRGQVAFDAFTFQSSGTYLYDHGAISVLLDANTPMPGTDVPLGTLTVNSMNDSADIAFIAQPFPMPTAILTMTDGAISTLAQDGDPAPGGFTYGIFFPDVRYGPFINNARQVAFATDLYEGGRAVFFSSQGSTAKIAGPGDVAPGGGVFVSADAPSINQSGQVTFFGQLDDGSVGIYLYSTGVLSRVAGIGDRVKGNRTFTFVDSPYINDAGAISFSASISDGSGSLVVATPSDDEDATTTLTVGRSATVQDSLHKKSELIQKHSTRPVHRN